MALAVKTETPKHEEGRTLVFNSPLETGLRAVIILTACYPRALGLDQLVALDHFIVHTEDVGGPPSLHPPEEARAAELLVRRDVVRAGLSLMGLKGLTTQHATETGFSFRAGDDAGNFVDLLSTPYSRRLVECAEWLAANVVTLDEAQFDDLISRRLETVLLLSSEVGF